MHGPALPRAQPCQRSRLQRQRASLRPRTSLRRYLECRLAPTHKDPEELQVTRFDALSELSEEELARLRARFHPTDDLTYQEYVWRVLR